LKVFLGTVTVGGGRTPGVVQGLLPLPKRVKLPECVPGPHALPLRESRRKADIAVRKRVAKLSYLERDTARRRRIARALSSSSLASYDGPPQRGVTGLDPGALCGIARESARAIPISAGDLFDEGKINFDASGEVANSKGL